MASRGSFRLTTVLSVGVVIALLAGAGYVLWDRSRPEPPDAPSPKRDTTTTTVASTESAADALRAVLETSAGPGTASLRRAAANQTPVSGTLTWAAGDAYSLDEGSARQVRRVGDTMYLKMPRSGIPDALIKFQRYPASGPGEAGYTPASGFVPAVLYYLGTFELDPAQLGDALPVSRSGSTFTVTRRRAATPEGTIPGIPIPTQSSTIASGDVPAEVTLQLTVRDGKVIAVSSSSLAGQYSATLSYGPVTAPTAPPDSVELPY